MLPLTVVLRHLVRSPARLGVTISGVSFAVFLMVFQGSLLTGFITASQKVIHTIGGDAWVIPKGVTCFDFAARLPRRYGEMVRGVPGVSVVTPVVAQFTTFNRPDGQRRAVLMVGAPGDIRDWPEHGGPDEVAIDASTAALLGVTHLPADAELGGHRARVSHIVDGYGSFLGSPYIFTSLVDAKRVLGFGDEEVSYHVLSFAPGAVAAQTMAALRVRLPEVDVLTTQEFASQSAMFWLIQTGAGGAILTAGLLGFAVGMAIVSQTLYASTMEALGEFATLKALGASDATIRWFVITQAIIVGIAGGAVGVTMTWPLVSLARAHLVAWVETPWWLVIAALVAGVAMCIGASLASVRQAVRVDPAAALRYWLMRLGVRDLTVTYQRGSATVAALSNVNADFESGTVTLVLGPSGSGKTSLLSVIGCMLAPTTGFVCLGDERIDHSHSTRRSSVRLNRFGFVFQNFRLLHCLTACENVMLPLQLRGVGRAVAREQARHWLSLVGLAGRAEEATRRLSGGEQQRVAIARALVGRPDVVLADEPTAALDAESGMAVAQLLRAAAVEHGAVVVVVTHDDRLKSVSDRQLKLTDGRLDGRLTI